MKKSIQPILLAISTLIISASFAGCADSEQAANNSIVNTDETNGSSNVSEESNISSLQFNITVRLTNTTRHAIPRVYLYSTTNCAKSQLVSQKSLSTIIQFAKALPTEKFANAGIVKTSSADKPSGNLSCKVYYGHAFLYQEITNSKLEP